MALGELVGGVADIYGGNKAANIERRATRKAGKYLDEGYQGGIDLAKPMQETAAGDFQRQSDRYNAGEFSNPDQQKYQAGNFDFDPNSIFQDPEYKASLKAAQQGIQGTAAAHGGLFSGRTAMDLQNKASDLFANRSDELYGRARGEYENNRNFDYGAENRAYDTNAANRKTDFTEGNILADYAPGQTENLIDLGLGRAQSKADTELGVGAIRANNYRSAYGKGGALAKDAVNGFDPTKALNLGKRGYDYLSGGASAY
ncbi:MAG: hypothetical protein V4563_17160 [Pseudomonadota bacterium]